MKFLSSCLSILILYFGFVSDIFANPVPYAGKVSINGINFDGTAQFTFELRDSDQQVHWRNGKKQEETISVPVKNGRYLVLLGGQGMKSLPSTLFLEQTKLFLRVFADLGDGLNLRHLTPDQRITSTPHALSAEWARNSLLAEDAKTAREVREGAITGKMLSS